MTQAAGVQRCDVGQDVAEREDRQDQHDHASDGRAGALAGQRARRARGGRSLVRTATARAGRATGGRRVTGRIRARSWPDGVRAHAGGAMEASFHAGHLHYMRLFVDTGSGSYDRATVWRIWCAALRVLVTCLLGGYAAGVADGQSVPGATAAARATSGRFTRLGRRPRRGSTRTRCTR